MKADPICNRQVIFLTLYIARLAQNPRKLLKAVHLEHILLARYKFKDQQHLHLHFARILPGFGQGASDDSWRILGSKYRNGRVFQAHPDTHKNPSCEGFLPGSGCGPADCCQDTKSRDEGSATTANEMVDEVRKPVTNKRRPIYGTAPQYQRASYRDHGSECRGPGSQHQSRTHQGMRD
jgi:hypothetical protein